MYIPFLQYPPPLYQIQPPRQYYSCQMHNDLLDRKKKLQRRISHLEQKVQDKKVNQILSSLENSSCQRRFSADATVKNINRPPIHRRLEHSKIQHLQEIVKATVQKQHALESEIEHLKSMIRGRSKQQSIREYSPDTDRNLDTTSHQIKGNVNRHLQNYSQIQSLIRAANRSPMKEIYDHPNYSLNNPATRRYEAHSVLGDQPLSSSDSCFSPENVDHQRLSKSLTVCPKPKRVSNIKVVENRQRGEVQGVQREQRIGVQRVRGNRIIVSQGTKKFMDSRIRIRIKGKYQNRDKSKKKEGEDRFQEMMERRNKLREVLLKRVFKIKNVKKYK